MEKKMFEWKIKVVALRSILRDEATKKQQQVSTTGGHTEMSGEETVESTSIIPGCSNYNNMFNVDDCSPLLPPPYWPTLPSSYPWHFTLISFFLISCMSDPLILTWFHSLIFAVILAPTCGMPACIVFLIVSYSFAYYVS